MSRVLLYLSQPGGHSDGIIRGTIQDYVEIAEEDSNSGEGWINSGLDLATGRSAVNRNGGTGDKLLLLVSREPCDLAVCENGADPTAVKVIPIPVAPEGMTGYTHLIGREVTGVYVRFPTMPDTEPTQPWWRFFWPF